MQTQPDGDIIYNVTYSFTDCQPVKPRVDTLDVRVRPCSNNTDAVLMQPMDLHEVKVATLPAGCKLKSVFWFVQTSKATVLRI